MPPTDRTVHAVGDGVEVVRYDRGGKWWVEAAGARRPVTLGQAVDVAVRMARSGNGVVHLGRPGGAQFDAAVRRARVTR